MKLDSGAHLAYCTNIHRGETWEETFASLESSTLAVRNKLLSKDDEPFAIGLRLSAEAAQGLREGSRLDEFRRWLDAHHCYIFTINGFPYGRFHGTRVKEQVYVPDWRTPERLEYTKLLFDILAELLPDGVEGSVSTVPGSYKAFIESAEQEDGILRQLARCVEHIDRLSQKSGKALHLGLEPEPLGWLENIEETIQFFARFRDYQRQTDLWPYLGVNYDTCHQAIEFEEPTSAIQRLVDAEIRLSKIHLSSALKVRPTDEARQRLSSFLDDVYLHQVIAKDSHDLLTRYSDLDLALQASPDEIHKHQEWRIHFHIPLHAPGDSLLHHTGDHLLGVLDYLGENPSLCSHLEIETYTWEVLPPELRSKDVVEQLVSEYQWCFQALAERGLHRPR